MSSLSWSLITVLVQVRQLSAAEAPHTKVVFVQNRTNKSEQRCGSRQTCFLSEPSTQVAFCCSTLRLFTFRLRLRRAWFNTGLRQGRQHVQGLFRETVWTVPELLGRTALLL